MLELIKRSLDAFGASDWEAFKACFAPNGVYEEYATRRRVSGINEIVAINKAWKTAFPDAKGTVLATYETGNGVITEVEWQGTNTGALETAGGILPASNKRVTVKAVMISKLRDGLIVEQHHYFDMLGLLQQLGAPVIGALKPTAEVPVFH